MHSGWYALMNANVLSKQLQSNLLGLTEPTTILFTSFKERLLNPNEKSPSKTDPLKEEVVLFRFLPFVGPSGPMHSAGRIGLAAFAG